MSDGYANPVTIADDTPHDGLVTISYCPQTWLVAKTLTLPRAAFFAAAAKLADEQDAASKRTPVAQST